MDTLSYKTRSINKENADKKWWLVDAEGQTLGRLSTQIATLLRGKHKTNFTPHADCGDYVVVVNAEKVVLTGNKMETKTYMRYTGYPGGQRERTASEQLKRKPFASGGRSRSWHAPQEPSRKPALPQHARVRGSRPQARSPATNAIPIERLMDVINTSGRRKTSVARIYMKPGKGEVTINKRPLVEYFTTGTLQYKINQPFTITETAGQYDVNVNVYGGGITGQAEAVRLAVSKALIEVNPEWKSALKAEGLTTRDPRMVERKKYGQKKARKKEQFSKR